ncbi:Imm41 family immunity protein [Cognatilysobacter lacus]|uniref:Immunity protein 41 n=1 Tax=Cognatilysobacter lacus TaxID=1643323 RepID=A0A5D8Z0V2_9GAMM|nr:Imm41 family immunity protein [Lysobacter lacus]TZF88349.1 hypothetical protein FW784_10075 [Lysobacter lacus]
MDAYTVIARNHPWSGEFDETSFRACLYEDATWSQDEYWKVEWALFQLVGAVGSDPELRRRAFRLFSATFSLFAAHLDPNDVYTIQNMEPEKLYEAKERFQLVFEGFFAGEMPDLSAGFDERNPLLSSGS